MVQIDSHRYLHIEPTGKNKQISREPPCNKPPNIQCNPMAEQLLASMAPSTTRYTCIRLWFVQSKHLANDIRRPGRDAPRHHSSNYQGTNLEWESKIEHS